MSQAVLSPAAIGYPCSDGKLAEPEALIARTR